DVSLVMVLMDTNPFFWGGQSPPLTFPQFLQHVLAFFNSILLLHQMNQLVVIGTGMNSCELIYDSSNPEYKKNKGIKVAQEHVIPSIIIVQQLEDFMKRDHALCKDNNATMNGYSLLSGSLSMALCYIQKILRGGPLHPQPRILCLQGSPDGPQQYVAVMNAIFSAQRSMVPIDACIVGNQQSAFLQQASHITGGIYLKPQQPEGLFQFLAMVFATDLHSRRFLQLPRPTGVDFRASCFCHKKTIDMGYVCSVCLSIFCGPSKKCSTC
ncbi:hypothetical protein KI387_037234, partial [Taxus chinensis]